MSAARKQRNDVPKKSADAPATQGMVIALKDAMNSRFDSLAHEMAAGFKGVDSRFADIDGRLASIEARFSNIDAQFSNIDARFSSFEARLSSFEARFSSFEARFSSFEARFLTIDARFESLEAKVDLVLAKVSEMAVKNEEQRSDNRVVLEGLHLVYQRQDRTETELKHMNAVLREIARARLQPAQN